MKIKIASIYKITNKINDKCYIGVTKNKPEYRWRLHETRNDNHCQSSIKILYRAFDKYGIENFTFEVIYQSFDLEYTLKVMEPYFIKKYNSYYTENGYNETLGGDGIWGYKFNKKQLEHLSEVRKKLWLNPEYRNNYIQKMTGKKHTEEHKQKTSSTLKERYSKEDVAWKGKPQTEEANKKRHETMKGRKLSPQCYEAGRQRESLNWLITFPDGHTEKIFNMRAFCKANGLDAQNLWKTSKGLIKHSKGFSAIKLNNNAG